MGRHDGKGGDHAGKAAEVKAQQERQAQADRIAKKEREEARIEENRRQGRRDR